MPPERSISEKALDILTLEEFKSVSTTDLETGLTPKEIETLRGEYGFNDLPQRKKWNFAQSLLKQLSNPLALILIAAGVATFFLNEILDAIVIAAALVINVIVGLFQEGRAGKAFEKLASSREVHSIVIRDGARMRIPSREIVVGDILVLEAGHYIPADARLIEADELYINESALTGESEEVEKGTDLQGEGVFSKHVAYAGTVVTAGQGKGVVLRIGSGTEFGGIASMLSVRVEPDTPVEVTLKSLSRYLSSLALIVVSVIFVLGLLRGEDLFSMLLISIAVAVSVVPEGLPAAVTVVLAIGMEKILLRGGLVRNLLAAETLGSTTVILTDKTGTLTQGNMTLSEIVPSSDILYPPIHAVERHEGDKAYTHALAASASDAFFDPVLNDVHGRPVERAIIRAWRETGMGELGKRLQFIPFSSETRAAYALIDHGEEGNLCIATGAPEYLLSLSRSLLRGNVSELLPQEWKRKLEQFQKDKAKEGKRLTAIAYAKVKDERISLETLDQYPWVFAGFLIFEDEMREDVKESVFKAKAAGARVIMVTGDNPGTALAIASEAGIADMSSEVFTGDMVEKMSDEELSLVLKRALVFSRITPRGKLRISTLLQSQGEIVAMTGDGINDAPALRNANIGIAVGSGTEVAKEASDLILLNSSFSVIVSAIEEGRRILDNLKKIVAHLLSTSLSEITLITGALLLALPLPILPTQILWINIIQGGLLNFAYAFEPASPHVMKRSPRDLNMRTVLTRDLKDLIIFTSVLTGVFIFGFYILLTELGLPIEEIRTILFISLSLDTILFTLSLKDFYQELPDITFRNNKFLLVSLGVSLLLLISTFVVPPLTSILSLTPLTLYTLPALVVAIVANIIIIETAKRLFFRKRTQEE